MPEFHPIMLVVVGVVAALVAVNAFVDKSAGASSPSAPPREQAKCGPDPYASAGQDGRATVDETNPVGFWNSGVSGFWAFVALAASIALLLFGDTRAFIFSALKVIAFAFFGLYVLAFIIVSFIGRK